MKRDTFSMFCYYSKMTIKSWFQYRVDAILRSLAVFLREATGIISMVLLFMKFDGLQICSWNINELVFLYSFLFVTYGILIIFFTGLRDFPSSVQNGTFDRILLRPRGILFQILASDADWFAAIGHGGLGIVLLVISSVRLGIHWTPQNIAYYLVSILGGVLIQAAIFLFIASLSFYFVKTNYVKSIMYYTLRQIAGYPISLFPRILQIIMICVVPFAFVNYFPAQYFVHAKDMALYSSVNLYLSPLIGVFLYSCAYLFWRYSMRYYKSTGN